MSAAAVVILCLLAWMVLSVVLSPVIGARLAGRAMTPAERDLVTWGGLGLFMALFFLAVLLIGIR